MRDSSKCDFPPPGTEFSPKSSNTADRNHLSPTPVPGLALNPPTFRVSDMLAPSPRMLLLRQQLAAERQQLAAEDDTRLDELATVRGRAAAPGVPGLIRRALPGDETSRVSSESPERSELAYSVTTATSLASRLNSSTNNPLQVGVVAVEISKELTGCPGGFVAWQCASYKS